MILNLKNSFKLYCILAAITLIYNLLIYLIGQVFFVKNAKGSLLIDSNNQIRGSELIGQNFVSPCLFNSRPIAPKHHYKNLPIYDQYLLHKIGKDIKNNFFTEMVTFSYSSYDPYITIPAAVSQIKRIIYHTNLTSKEALNIISAAKIKPLYPFFEEELLNVVKANYILQQKIGKCKPVQSQDKT